jgi:hypothetical protein
MALMSSTPGSTSLPWRRTGTTAALVAIAVLVVIQAVASLTRAPNYYDDGVQLTGAMLLLRGQIPNVDFYSVYPPFNCYLLAAAFKLLGESVVVYRIVQTTAAWITVTTVVVTAFRLLPLAKQSWPYVFLAVLLLNFDMQELQAATGIMWLTLAVSLLLVGRTTEGSVAAILRAGAGLALAALAWTRLNFALYLGCAWSVDALATLRDRQAASRRRVQAELIWFVAPACLAAVVFAFIWGGSIRSLLQQIVVSTMKSMAITVLAPIPGELSLQALKTFFSSGVLAPALPLAWLAVTTGRSRGPRAAKAMWIATGLVTSLVLVIGRVRPVLLSVTAFIPIAIAGFNHFLIHPHANERERTESFFLLLLALQSHYVLSRPDTYHFCGIFLSIGFLFLISLTYDDRKTRARLIALLCAVVAVPVVSNVLFVVARAYLRGPALRAVPALLRSEDAVLSTGCGKPCEVFVRDVDAHLASDYIRLHTSDGDRVFSGMQYQGGYPGNDVRAYWLMRRPTGVHDVMLTRGLTTTAAAEQQIMNDLESNRVRWLLLWNGLTPPPETPPLTPLDRFVRDRYRVEKQFGQYEVWHRLTPFPQP